MHQGSSARLYILCGPTAVGKGTVVGSLRAQYPGKFYLSISATTRQPRPGEVNGQSYFFVDREQFIRDRDAGQMLEWAEVHGQNFYGTPAAPVDEALAQGLPVLLEIDLAGARQVKAQRDFPGAALVGGTGVPPGGTRYRVPTRTKPAPANRTNRTRRAVRIRPGHRQRHGGTSHR